MNNKILIPLCALAGLILSACGPSQAQLAATSTQVAEQHASTLTAGAPTSTSTPVPTSTPTPIPTPTITPTVDPQSCQPGPLLFLDPLSSKKDIGKIDGARFYKSAQTLNGDHVDIVATVIESQHFVDSPNNVDGTLVLVYILGNDGNKYEATIFIPDQGAGIDQYIPNSNIKASGVHLGYFKPPEKFFTAFQNTDGKVLPTMIVDNVSGGCVIP